MEGSGYYWDPIVGKRRLKGNEVIVLFPGLPHAYGPELPTDHWVEQFVVFDGPIFRSFEEEGLLVRDRTIVDLEGDSKWASAFYQFIIGLRDGRSVLRLEKGVADLHVLIVGLMTAHTKADSWVEQAVERLGKNLAGDLDMNLLAAESGMGEQAFRKAFRAETGFAPYQFRLRCRLEWARGLLLKGSDGLEVIARECGFCDHYHFSRQFKKVFGLSPGAYRKSQGVGSRGKELQRRKKL
jgi:AraC-like DNA-binding protein